MMKIVCILLIVFGVSNLLQAQKLSSNITKYYEFNLCASPHTIILIEKNNRINRGMVFTSLRKSKSQKKIVRKTKLDPSVVKSVIAKLNDLGINEVDKTYKDSLVYLDGDALEIKLLRDGIVNNFYFDEIYPVKSKKIETHSLMVKVQSWVTLVDQEFALDEIFANIKSKLRKGEYCYSLGAIYIKCFTIK